VPKEVVRHMVGKNGWKIKDMIQKHTVEITSEKDENDNLHMRITGNGAKEEISEIIDIQQQNLETTKEKKQKHLGTVCRNYQENGECKFGGTCWYDHRDLRTQIGNRTTSHKSKPRIRPRDQ